MKILIVNRFFGGAQIPTGRMAEDVARVLVEAGHEVTALASSGEYAGAVAQALKATDYGASERQCFSDAVKTEIPADRATDLPGPVGTLRVEQIGVAKWMPRALAWVWFTWCARKRIPRMDWDVCVLMTDPPLLPLLAARLKDQKTKRPKDFRRIAVWLMDLYPEALAASGRIGIRNPIYKWYFNKRQRALASVDLLICLGEAQRERLGAGGGEIGVSVGQCFSKAVRSEKPKNCPTEIPTPPLTARVRTAVVPPWDDRANIAPASEKSLRNLALYAGNLGEAHCFEEILAAAPHLPADWTIRFAVRGAKLDALKEKAKGISHRLTRIDTDGVRAAGADRTSKNAHAGGPPALAVSPPNKDGLKLTDLKLKTAGAVVHVSGYASEDQTPKLLASARVHLITMSLGWEGIVVPSKLYGCVRTGRPVLFIGPENADTAREIRAHDWGKVLPPGASGEEVAAAILELAVRPTRVTEPRNGARQVAKLIEALATD